MKNRAIYDTDSNDQNDAHMSRALELARRGTALAHPNPRVGAVVVKDGKKIGEGSHVYDKLDHAEIVALKQAGEKSRGATLYVAIMFVVGGGFDKDPLLPWVPPVLNSPVSANQKADQLFSKALAELKRWTAI